tara:strand:+ start:282 stop:935 length:654 start_codon:yes stop_codon:yes gene_type:complete
MKFTPKKYNQKFFYNYVKAFFDIIFAFIVLTFCFPIFIIIALLIKLSSRGPIFYYQKRIGKNREYFKCIKFRTMYPEADDILRNLINNDKNLRKEFEDTHKLKDDPRITNIGKILRKTSLDELPQFINVIRSEMSVVGPRPIVDHEKIKYGSSFKKVNSINPGITGLWQVSGRNNLSYSRRVILDSIYVEKYNFLMDIGIIFRTLGVLIFPRDRGAY